MDENIKGYYRQTSDKVIKNLDKRNIDAFYCDNTEDALKKVLEMIPRKSSIGMAGSMTLKEIGLLDAIAKSDYKVYNQYMQGLSKEESLRIRREGTTADYFVSGTNAITLDGEIVNFNAMGNRVAGIAYAKKTIIVAGANKIVNSLQDALSRVRNYSTPINCKRLNMNTPCAETGICDSENCFFPERQRNCCQILIIESEWTRGRLNVVLVGESLGF